MPAAVVDLGAKIRDARRRKDLTQTALAELLGRGQPAVCGWECNKARPPVNMLAELARVLDLDLGELMRAAGLGDLVGASTK